MSLILIEILELENDHNSYIKSTKDTFLRVKESYIKYINEKNCEYKNDPSKIEEHISKNGIRDE